MIVNTTNIYRRSRNSSSSRLELISSDPHPYSWKRKKKKCYTYRAAAPYRTALYHREPFHQLGRHPLTSLSSSEPATAPHPTPPHEPIPPSPLTNSLSVRPFTLTSSRLQIFFSCFFLFHSDNITPLPRLSTRPRIPTRWKRRCRSGERNREKERQHLCMEMGTEMESRGMVFRRHV